MKVVRVALDIGTRSLNAPFEYDVPPALSDQVLVGCAVFVEFGRRRVLGYVLELRGEGTHHERKPILAVVSGPLFDTVASSVIQWIASEYVASLAESVRLFLPPGWSPKVLESQSGWSLGASGAGPVSERVIERVTASDFVPGRRAHRQRALLAALEHGPLTDSELRALLGPVGGLISRLSRAGAIRVSERRRSRAPVVKERSAPRHRFLSAGQVAALDAIETAAPGSGVLLRGVTGSGKTEVYIRAIERLRKQGKSAIVLVPEISLTPQTVGRFRTRFGADVAVLHSRLSPGERFDEYDRVRNGEASVVIGARSALFAPAHDLGLIVIDEEHESSYKQGSSPRYVTRDVARLIARERGAVVVLGSATPSMEALEDAQHGRWRLVELPGRVGGGAEAAVAVVDLAAEFNAGNRSIFSRRLVRGLEEVAARGEKAILLLNRRGYATFLLCRECGHVPRCTECATSFTLHESGPYLMCHHCARVIAPPAECPSCAGPYLRRFGAGTQRVAEEVSRVLPSTPVIRMDADTTGGRRGHDALLELFESHSSAVLVGTQMIAKGLDYPDVTLVGVVSADTTLHIPDFRAGERTFQLLQQVSGRAGRGRSAGRVIIQTYWPDHPAIRAVELGDPEVFYAAEREERAALGYPPYGRIGRIVTTSVDLASARSHAELLAGELRAVPGCEVLGPSPAPLARIRGRHRWHSLVKEQRGAPISAPLRAALHACPAPRGVSVVVDVDPVDLT